MLYTFDKAALSYCNCKLITTYEVPEAWLLPKLALHLVLTDASVAKK